MSNVLVIATHSIDCTLACNWRIVQHLAAGDTVNVLLLTRNNLHDFRAAINVSFGNTVGHKYAEDLPKGKLKQYLHYTALEIQSALLYYNADIVYVPSRNEPKSEGDHVATWQALQLALRMASSVLFSKQLWLYEYPVWQYCTWPFVDLPARRKHKSLANWLWQCAKYWTRSATNAVHYGDQSDYSVVVQVSHVSGLRVASKRYALQYHKNELPGLQDIGNGSFLQQFMCREVFRKTLHTIK